MTLHTTNKKADSDIFSTNEKAIIGIINITKDSFYDGGKYLNDKQIILRCKNMLDDGATIIEIGAQSSRPGAIQVSSKEELKKLLPSIKLLKKNFKNITISIDTFWANTAKECIIAGANIINDISAGNIDENIFNVIAEFKTPYIIMHMQGTPRVMQKNPKYDNVVNELVKFFDEKIKKLNNLGVHNIIIDPGFGFGKTIQHNFQILNQLHRLKEFNLPILIGASRKSMIYNLLETTAENALNGTSIVNTIALTNGANILRVHDVKEANECIKITTFAKNNS